MSTFSIMSKIDFCQSDVHALRANVQGPPIMPIFDPLRLTHPMTLDAILPLSSGEARRDHLGSPKRAVAILGRGPQTSFDRPFPTRGSDACGFAERESEEKDGRPLCTVYVLYFARARGFLRTLVGTISLHGRILNRLLSRQAEYRNSSVVGCLIHETP